MTPRSDIHKDVGRLLVGILERLYGAVPSEVKAALERGDYQNGSLAKALRASSLAEQIALAVKCRFGEGDERVREQLVRGNYREAVQYIGELAIAEGTKDLYFMAPTDAAQRLCGSVLEFRSSAGPLHRALISRTVAWEEVGGDDQLLPLALPGTIGYWHSARQGGYDIAAITAHQPGETGIVTITGVRTLDERIGAENTNKGEIVDKYGFKRCKGGNVRLPSTPLRIVLRENGNTATLLERGFTVQNDLDGMRSSKAVGAYKLCSDK